MPTAIRELEVRRLGTIAYDDALALQRALVEERRAGRVPDLLLLLQHPPVITLGVKGDGGRANILASEERLRALGVTTHETGRGGDVTYHGPGQIVGYPILDLRPDRCDVHRYVRDVEEVMMRVCADYGVTAGRIKGLTGAWVGAEDRRCEDRRHWRPHLPVDYEPRLCVQRQHEPRALSADRAVRDQRSRRDVAGEADREAAADRGGRRRVRAPVRGRVRAPRRSSGVRLQADLRAG